VFDTFCRIESMPVFMKIMTSKSARRLGKFKYNIDFNVE
jgi:hypothetical protein